MAKKQKFLNKYIRDFFSYLPISDALYVKLKYFYIFHRFIDLKNPKAFNEKIQWMNLNGYFEKYSALSDKYAVREYIAKKVGRQYLNKLYGVYDHASEIDYETLPQEFVLKVTHGSHWNILCKDKDALDKKAARKQLDKWLNQSYYRLYRESVYRHIKPRIICERFIKGENNESLIDSKFLCFNGRVQYISITINYFSDLPMYAGIYYDRNWERCPFTDSHSNPIDIEKPRHLKKMIEVAEKLAEGIPFVRVDLYDLKSSFFCGELTFSPDAGFGELHPPEWNYKLGQLLDLPAED